MSIEYPTKLAKELTGESFMKYFRHFAPKFGLEGSIYLNKLIEKREMVYSKPINQRLGSVINLGKKAADLIKDDWFFCLASHIEKDTSMTRRRQEKARKILLDAGVIEVKLAGCPQRQFFKLNDDKIIKIVNEFNSEDHFDDSDE